MAVRPVRVVFAGTPDVAVPSLRALIDSEHDVVGVISRPDARAGRGRTLQPSPVSLAADESGIEIRKPRSLTDDADFLREWRPDVVAVVAYGVLIPTVLIDAPPSGWINAHFSLLPAWRGAAPVQHAIAHGDELTGVTTFRIDAGLDTGPILMESAPVIIGEREDSGSLLARLAPIGADLLVRTIDALAAGDAALTPQPEQGVSLAPRITTDDARIRWNQPVHTVDRWVRACTPAPGAWTVIDGERLRVGVPDAAVADASAQPGRIEVSKSSVQIGCTGGYLVLGDVQPKGKKAMPARDWVRGFRGDLTAIEMG